MLFSLPPPPETRAGGELEPLQPHPKDNPSWGRGVPQLPRVSCPCYLRPLKNSIRTLLVIRVKQ